MRVNRCIDEAFGRAWALGFTWEEERGGVLCQEGAMYRTNERKVITRTSFPSVMEGLCQYYGSSSEKFQGSDDLRIFTAAMQRGME